MDDKLEHWRSWIGRGEEASDVLDAGRARALQATLDDPGPPLQDGDPLPALWQWVYFWNIAPTATLGADGHPARGAFMPPIDLPRRMWAGCRVSVHRPLTIGQSATRRMAVTDVQSKTGKNGPLAFVTVRTVYADAQGDCIDEELDIAYRGAGTTGVPPGEPAPSIADWRLALTPHSVLLFRYSALTFNGHRIHHDRDYATRVEGYPDILVHGPLMAMLMGEVARRKRQGAGLRSFACRAQRPCFADRPMEVAGKQTGEGAELWVADQDGFVAMRGTAGWI